MTGFGKISPLGQHIYIFSICFRVYSFFWQNFEISLSYFFVFGKMFFVVSGQKLELYNLAIWSHCLCLWLREGRPKALVFQSFESSCFFYTFRIHLRMEISRQVIYLPRRTFKLVSFQKRNICFRREPWSSVYGRRLRSWRLLVRIPIFKILLQTLSCWYEIPIFKKNICVQKNASLMGNHSVVIRGTLGSMPSYGNSFSVEKIALSKRSEKLEK